MAPMPPVTPVLLAAGLLLLSVSHAHAAPPYEVAAQRLRAAQEGLSRAFSQRAEAESAVRAATRRELAANAESAAANADAGLLARAEYMSGVGVEMRTMMDFAAGRMPVPDADPGDRVAREQVQRAAFEAAQAAAAAQAVEMSLSLHARAVALVADAQEGLAQAEEALAAIPPPVAPTADSPAPPAPPSGSAVGDCRGAPGQVWSGLLAAGVSPAAAAGVLGNLQQESGVNPAAVQQGGPGRGLAQWSTGGRWDTSEPNLLAHAQTEGLDPWSTEAQVSFMLREMRLGWGGFDFDEFRMMQDPVEAAVYFHDVYEVSADSDDFVRSVRGGNAVSWLARMSSPGCS